MKHVSLHTSHKHRHTRYSILPNHSTAFAKMLQDTDHPIHKHNLIYLLAENSIVAKDLKRAQADS